MRLEKVNLKKKFFLYFYLDFVNYAISTYQMMKTYGYSPDLFSLNSLLYAYEMRGDYQHAEIIFRDIQSKFTPNIVTYTSLINTYAKAIRKDFQNSKNYIEKGEMIFEKVLNVNIQPTSRLLNCVLNLYTTSFHIKKAETFFNSVFEKYNIQPDLFAYSSMLKMYQYTKKIDKVLKYYYQMIEKGIKPDKFVYEILVMSHAQVFIILILFL